MSKSEYSTEDFVLDPDFRKWVLENHPESKIYWEDFLNQYPEKVKEIFQAREILVHLSREKKELSQDQVEFLFANISREIALLQKAEVAESSKVVSLDSWATIQRYNLEKERMRRRRNRIRWAASLALIMGFSTIFYWFKGESVNSSPELVAESVTFEAPAGVKSSISLEDGSKVHLNSGSRITYPKNFSEDKRLIRLEGEAFFEVAKDPNRPFMVNSGHLTTTALGTSFNIKAYPNQFVAVSLVTGKVRVEDQNNQANQALLSPGEGIQADLEKHLWKQSKFDLEEILAWMNKTLVFKNTPLKEAILQMENWYGVKVHVAGEIPKDLSVSGKFKDETLQNILEGLSFSARFSYKIQGKQVQLTFKP